MNSPETHEYLALVTENLRLLALVEEQRQSLNALAAQRAMPGGVVVCLDGEPVAVWDTSFIAGERSLLQFTAHAPGKPHHGATFTIASRLASEAEFRGRIGDVAKRFATDARFEAFTKNL